MEEEAVRQTRERGTNRKRDKREESERGREGGRDREREKADSAGDRQRGRDTGEEYTHTTHTHTTHTYTHTQCVMIEQVYLLVILWNGGDESLICLLRWAVDRISIVALHPNDIGRLRVLFAPLRKHLFVGVGAIWQLLIACRRGNKS